MTQAKSQQPMENAARQMVEEIQQYAVREPATAVAVAFGVGLLINLLPTRVIAGTASAVGGVLLQPALMTLGVLKAVELCCQKPSLHS